MIKLKNDKMKKALKISQNQEFFKYHFLKLYRGKISSFKVFWNYFEEYSRAQYADA